MTPPKVFISYSHDSPAHDAEVLALANRLRGNGIDAVLDQYESFPRRGWMQWMKDQVRGAQFVLVICTETYRRRWDGEEKPGEGLGAIYESQLVQQLLYDAGGVNERFVPVLLGESDTQRIPLELRKYTHFGPSTEAGYEALYRLLTNQPKVQKPILGPPLPFLEPKPDFRNFVWNVPPRNPFFTGRAAHLEAIRRALTQTSSAALTQPQAISGLGGIGKTQTAIEYAHRYRGDYPAVLWCGADSRDTLLSGFAAFANLLNLPQKDEPDVSVVAQSVGRWLESNAGWLLVLDNVEDLALAGQFAPAGAPGHLLITTRLRATGESAELVELRKMEPTEGALFLLRRGKLIRKDQPLEAADQADRELAQQISEEMDGLPLALDQAGAFIEETPSTLAEYLNLYRAEGAALRARRGTQAAGHASVSITFSLAFARVAQASPAAADVVRACAFLAPDAIPEEVFTQAGSEWGKPITQLAAQPLAWLEAIEAAGKFALIRRDAGNKSLYIHRLVQEVIKDEMDEGTRRAWAERVVGALDKVFPSPEFENWPRCERLLPQAKMAARLAEGFGSGSAAAAARLLNKTGYYLYERAQYAEAEPLYQRSLAIWEKALGPDHPDVATSLNNLASLYYSQGKYAEAEPLYQRALANRKKALGPDHPDVALSLTNLAELYHSQGRYAEAEPLYQRSLAIGEKTLGPDHPNVAQSLNNLAELYRSQGKYAEAEPLFQRSLVILEKALGPDHPNVAGSLNNLALLYGNQGKYAEAEPLYQRSLAIYEIALGPDHPRVARSLNNLAALCHSQGKYAEAEPLYQRSLAIREKALGLDHPDVAQSLNNLAELYRSQGKYAEAEPPCQRALAIFEKALGPDHPHVASSLNNLALLYYNQGKYAEAEPLYQRSLAIREKALGLEHPDATAVTKNYAKLLRKLDRVAEAEKLEARARAAGA